MDSLPTHLSLKAYVGVLSFMLSLPLSQKASYTIEHISDAFIRNKTLLGSSDYQEERNDKSEIYTADISTADIPSFS